MDVCSAAGSLILIRPVKYIDDFSSCLLFVGALPRRRPLGRFTPRPAQVVYRQNLIGEDSVRIKAWLLRLSEVEQGHFYWDAPWHGDRPSWRYQVSQGQ